MSVSGDDSSKSLSKLGSFTRSTSGTGTMAPCFSIQDLQDPNLDINEFVANLRTKAPVPVIRDDLQNYLKELRQELVSRLQKNFGQFVSLGSNISEVDQISDTCVKTLESVKIQIDDVTQQLSDDVTRLEEALSKRRQLAARKTSVELFLRISELVNRCERLLKEQAELPNANSSDKCRLLERIATESSQLGFALSRAPKDSKFVSFLKARISKIESQVRDRLQLWFKDTLNQMEKNPSKLRDSLVTYALSGHLNHAYDTFSEHIMQPFTKDRLRTSSLIAFAEKEKGISNASPADAIEVCEAIVETFLNEKCLPIIQLCESDDRLHDFDFMSNAIWPEIQKSIVNKMSQVFSPGIPDVFHKCYKSARRLYKILEGLCKTEAHLHNLHTSPYTIEFWKKWNLPVYFQLRFQEVTKIFSPEAIKDPELYDENSVSSEGDKVDSNLLKYDIYKLKITRRLFIAIKRCWDEDFYLQPLSHRSLKLSLQLLAHYGTWIRQGVAEKWDASSPTYTAALSWTLSDLEKILDRFLPEIVTLLQIKASDISPEILSQMERCFSISISGMETLTSVVSDKICLLLSTLCINGLQPLRGILATYRMTNKPPPTNFSRFVPNILKPLKKFNSEQSDNISKERLKAINMKVVENTCEEYFSMATDLMANVRKAEDTLKRLNLGKQSKDTKSVKNSDMDKISLQLYLDVAKFGLEIEDLGIEKDSVESYVKLRTNFNIEQTKEDDEEESLT